MKTRHCLTLQVVRETPQWDLPGIACYEHETRTIYIRADLLMWQKTLVLCHELGHWFLWALGRWTWFIHRPWDRLWLCPRCRKKRNMRGCP